MEPERSFDPGLLRWPLTRRDQAKRPLFALARREGDLFFVNHSADVLDHVANASMGVVPAGDDEVAFTTTFSFRYDAVQPGEAVKVDEFTRDPWGGYEHDEPILTQILLDSPSHGRLKFWVADKGGVSDMVLLWEDGFVSPMCSMTRLGTPDEPPRRA
ncbi:MAG: hypothetical protein J0H15_07715 [Xanthomonadales bacterium]|nr:hypothetical protein [Xanthomonadales bacterium]